jgi:hypothetical protein
MKKIFYVCSAVVAIAVLTECKKKKDDTVAPAVTYTKTEMVAGTSTTGSKSWKITKETWGGSDITSSISACDLDDIIKFYRSGVYVELEGATKCNSTDPDTVDSGTWAFNAAQDSIFITSSGSVDKEKIKTLTTSTMELSNTDPNFGEFISTFTAQ